MKSVLAGLMNERVGSKFDFGGYRFRRAENELDREAVFSLRHRVFGEEGFIDPGDFRNGLFRDDFDEVSSQFMVFDASGELVATTRLVLPSDLGFPTERLFEFEPADVPRQRLGEYGRLAIARDHRGGGRTPMLGLLKCVFECMLEYQITHVFAFMPPKLAGSYALLGCVSVPLELRVPGLETLARRRPMRGYFARQEIQPVLFNLEEMMREIGISFDREEASYVI